MFKKYNSVIGRTAAERAAENTTITPRLRQGKLLDVGLLDQFVIGNGRHVSFSDEGLL